MILKIKDLSFHYYPFSSAHKRDFALKNISFEIKDPQILTILGPNGSGKSTLLKTILNILSPYEGMIEIYDKNIKQLPPQEMAKLCAFVPQENDININITPLDIVLMGRYPYQKRFSFESHEDIDIALNALKKVHCHNLINEPYMTLSGGEKKRVLIARALAQEAKILLLDEPTAYLDVAASLNLFELLKNLKANNGITSLIITHNLHLAHSFSDISLLMKKGSLHHIGTPKNLFKAEVLEPLFETKLYGNF